MKHLFARKRACSFKVAPHAGAWIYDQVPINPKSPQHRQADAFCLVSSVCGVFSDFIIVFEGF